MIVLLLIIITLQKPERMKVYNKRDFPFDFLLQIFSLSALFALIALATAQFGVYNGDFGPSGFSAGFPSAALTTGARDPRQNRGNQG